MNAGAWSDEPIGFFDERAILPFVTRRRVKQNEEIDPRKIIGTSHAAYRDGMTWREFLRYGKRMHGKVDGLQRNPGYYRNPSHDHDDQPASAGWSLLEIDGEYAIDEGNHRSVISRFLCEEERTNSQVVPVVTELTLDRDAMAYAAQLEDLLRYGQYYDIVSLDVGLDDDGAQLFDVLFHVWGSRISSKGPTTPIEALAAVKAANRWQYFGERLFAKLQTKRVVSADEEI